jgi:spore maturation protein CgeB
MKIVIFALSISTARSSEGASGWRGLCAALAGLGHRVVVFERDMPYFAANRDIWSVRNGRLRLYLDWAYVLPEVRRELADADVGLVSGGCPDGAAASEAVIESPVAVRCFYDPDAPRTLVRMRQGQRPGNFDPAALGLFDLVLSATGGEALQEFAALGARRVAALYPGVDPGVYRAVGANAHYRADLSYLGVIREDRREAIAELLIEPARLRQDLRFVIGGSEYPNTLPWTENIYFVRHLPVAEHPVFYSASRATLQVTGRAEAVYGYCPSAAMFEASACGVPIVSSAWRGIEGFFRPGSEIVTVDHRDDVLGALDLSDRQLRRIGQAGRQRTLDEHTWQRRAIELERLLDGAAAGRGNRMGVQEIGSDERRLEGEELRP